MWNQDLYLQALLFAGQAHCQQKIPASQMPYAVHFTNVAMEVAHALVLTNSPDLEATFAIQCALLHDTIEDTAVTYPVLVTTFGQKVADGVLALTKDKNLPKEHQMLDSLNRIIKQGAEIRMVKMADRINNLQAPPSHWDKVKIARYHQEALLILNTLGGVNLYIEKRLQQKIENYTQYL